uniref:Uncharacterized protein n=1 Tax=viral metagenome TaxID=1070528 RepID=A0A6C0IER4_9ZZZZ
MENIIEPNETFDFSKLSLAHPSGIQGGAYFTKIEYNSKPLYIQTAKSLTRQGFVKTGKKYYCDLMFDKNAETLINWFENLEIRCQKLILEKKDAWFQNTLEESDVESAFNSIIRIYKSGKYYLVRTNIRNNHTNMPSIKIYDETEIPLTMSDITNETNIISILEIQGIKFTSRNFQIEIELKQVMLLNNEPIFDNCLIKKDKPFKSLGDLIIQEETNRNPNSLGDLSEENNLNSNSLEVLDDLILDTENEDTNKNLEEFKEKELESLDVIYNDVSLDNTNVLSDIIIEELVEDDVNELKEIKVDLNLDNLETVHLKKPNQVYFELYKEARNKAKVAKKNAILAYLEAKNIKKTYMLENLNDSDSDFDAEIDDVSESELENL